MFKNVQSLHGEQMYDDFFGTLENQPGKRDHETYAYYVGNNKLSRSIKADDSSKHH